MLLKQNGTSALSAACASGKGDCLTPLVERGADIEDANKVNHCYSMIACATIASAAHDAVALCTFVCTTGNIRIQQQMSHSVSLSCILTVVSSNLTNVGSCYQLYCLCVPPKDSLKM